MSGITGDQISDTGAPEPGGNEEPQHSPIELQAMSMGWRPKDQWQGNEDDFVEAKEFVQRKSLFDKIDSQSRQIKNITRTLADFKAHYDNVERAAYQRAYNELKAQRRQALEEEDTRTALQLEDKMEQVQAEYAQKVEQQRVEQASQSKEPDPVFMQWVQQNQWYVNDPVLHNLADAVGKQYFDSHPTATEHDVFAHVEKVVKEKFPEKFPGNPRRAAPSPVDGGSQRTGVKRDNFKLPPEHQAIMERFVKTIPGFTKEQYIKDYKAQYGEE